MNILTDSQIQKMYGELLEFPNYVKLLSEYEISKIEDYAKRQKKEFFHFINDLLIHNPDLSSEYEYMKNNNSDYQNALKVISIIEGVKVKKDLEVTTSTEPNEPTLETKYRHDAKTTIYHAMIPSEPEPLVTYTFVTEDGGSRAVTMPRLFIELGNDFERWFNEEKHVLLRDFQYEYRQKLESKGNYYAKLIYDEFTTAWVNEQYYKDLVEIWEDWNKKHLEKQLEESKAKNYQQANYIQEKIKENRHLILKAKAALYFINQTKAFVKPDFGIPDIVQPIVQMLTPPMATSTDTNEGKKGGRTRDLYNAKIKAKFLSMVIDDGIVKNSTYRNNDEKFADYAKVLRDNYGLVVYPRTLENNWNKLLNEKEKKQLRELFIAQNLRKLALKVVINQ